MVEPITTGATIAGALAIGAGVVAKGMLGEAAKDAYKKLKDIVAHWASEDVALLENQARDGKPTAGRELVLAEAIEAQPQPARSEAAAHAASLVEMLRQEAERSGPVGVDIGRLEALEVDLGKIVATGGTAFRAETVRTGTFKTDGIKVGPGNS
jgi:hypothetical protein